MEEIKTYVIFFIATLNVNDELAIQWCIQSTSDCNKTIQHPYTPPDLTTQVISADTHIYHYEDIHFPTAITSITDGGASYSYGRMMSKAVHFSASTQAMQKNTAALSADGSSTVTNTFIALIKLHL